MRPRSVVQQKLQECPPVSCSPLWSSTDCETYRSWFHNHPSDPVTVSILIILTRSSHLSLANVDKTIHGSCVVASMAAATNKEWFNYNYSCIASIRVMSVRKMHPAPARTIVTTAQNSSVVLATTRASKTSSTFIAHCSPRWFRLKNIAAAARWWEWGKITFYNKLSPCNAENVGCEKWIRNNTDTVKTPNKPPN